MNDLDKILEDLQERVRLLERSYNSEQLNLHFDYSARADSRLFENLYAVGLEAWHVIRVAQSRKTAHWFDDFFLLLSSISVKIWDDHTQSKYPQAVIERLAVLLVEISQMTNNTAFAGDRRCHNHEALGNVLLAFDNSGALRNVVIKKAQEMNDPNVTDFVKATLESVSAVENRSLA